MVNPILSAPLRNARKTAKGLRVRNLAGSRECLSKLCLGGPVDSLAC